MGDAVSIFINAVGNFHARFVKRRQLRMLAAAFSDLIPKEAQSILDVGAGSGELANLIMRNRSVTITSIDVFVREATSIPVEPYDGRRIPYPDSAFDGVILSDVLHHAADPETLLRECGRVAKTFVVIKDHKKTGPLAGQRLALMDWVGNRPYGVELTFRFLASREWDDLIAKVGFRLVRELKHLALYPLPFDWLFGGSLQFAALFSVLRSQR